jgi:hypothetical protein
MEKTSGYGIKTYYLLFLNRQSLSLALRDMEIPDKRTRLTKLTMTNNCAMVKLRNVLSRQFDIKEGDRLACLLFNISLEKVI